ncbi:MAG: undecaprenyl diphosphate synthase family protein [Planctomycetota bacterium]
MASRLPAHIGIIPDGNRRWATLRGMDKSDGYAAGVEPGLRLLERCRRLGIQHATVYGFTQDNTRRPRRQQQAFRAACISFADAICDMDLRFRVLGDATSRCFPEALKPYCTRTSGSGMAVTMLANYGWEWDLKAALRAGTGPVHRHLASADLPRIDLIVRWGGCRRLSGFLPVQSVYADFHVEPALWPDYQDAQLDAALDWYQQQDRTLGG